MKRFYADNGIPTLYTALFEYMNANEIKKLARLTKSRVPTRKAELVEHIVRYLEGDRLKTVWERMDKLQRAAVAEVVHSRGTTFYADRFRAKYGRNPAWGSVDAYRRDEEPTPLRFFFYADGVMPDDLSVIFWPQANRPFHSLSNREFKSVQGRCSNKRIILVFIRKQSEQQLGL